MATENTQYSRTLTLSATEVSIIHDALARLQESLVKKIFFTPEPYKTTMKSEFAKTKKLERKFYKLSVTSEQQVIQGIKTIQTSESQPAKTSRRERVASFSPANRA